MQTLLRHLRISKGLTQQQVANGLKVSPETISALENGLLSELSAFYSVTIESLVAGCQITNDQIELLKFYKKLDDISKGALIERAAFMAEESSKQKG